MSEIILECDGIRQWFGDLKVLHDINLRVGRGQIVALVGPSGCGKSTLLRAIVGTHPPKAGEVRVNNEVTRSPGRNRGIVYQHYSLFPFLTAQENVAIGPMLDRTTLLDRMIRPLHCRAIRKELLAEADALLTRFKLGAALERYPYQLSGGMKQRVAIAQALIMKPEILLLDEPFGALDEATREELQDMLLELYGENQKIKAEGGVPPHTILIVTHELNEAIYVSNRILGLSQYWRYEDEGFAECPGATLIYDMAAPVVHADKPREPEKFVQQRHEIRNVVFAPAERYKHDEYVRFWANDAKANDAKADDAKADDAKADDAKADDAKADDAKADDAKADDAKADDAKAADAKADDRLD
ncbi:MAG: ATP-binding cassette domain-containing protein [Planctomycetes bacterium]|nr:ATP-binding cassette domain-containing protein [Planctomycetota bacterium]